MLGNTPFGFFRLGLIVSFALVMGLVSASCGDSGGASGGDGGEDPDGSSVDGGADSTVDSGPCAHQGELGDPCEDDCDCPVDARCRGISGQEVCSVPCEGYEDCAGARLGCQQDPICDMNAGACRCICEEATCPDGVCARGVYCLECVTSADCASHTCSEPDLDQPVCDPSTAECSCRGACGDGSCDGYEEATQSCPEDCTSPCQDGSVLPFSCTHGETVTWCRCESGAWVCEDPTLQCTGDTECARMGGSCAPSAGECYEGEPAADAHGCSGDSPVCCLAAECAGPGEEYYPGSGHCCAGLRALPSLELMSGMHPDVGGVMCFSTCWVQTCAPCGDGICQPHLAENFCNCPEDCSAPPYDLSCSDMSHECGTAYCWQDGETCHMETPLCQQGSCQWDSEQVPGAVCNTAERACEPL
jgi:hypothetical protein